MLRPPLFLELPLPAYSFNLFPVDHPSHNSKSSDISIVVSATACSHRTFHRLRCGFLTIRRLSRVCCCLYSSSFSWMCVKRVSSVCQVFVFVVFPIVGCIRSVWYCTRFLSLEHASTLALDVVPMPCWLRRPSLASSVHDCPLAPSISYCTLQDCFWSVF